MRAGAKGKRASTSAGDRVRRAQGNEFGHAASHETRPLGGARRSSRAFLPERLVLETFPPEVVRPGSLFGRQPHRPAKATAKSLAGERPHESGQGSAHPRQSLAMKSSPYGVGKCNAEDARVITEAPGSRDVATRGEGSIDHFAVAVIGTHLPLDFAARTSVLRFSKRRERQLPGSTGRLDKAYDRKGYSTSGSGYGQPLRATCSERRVRT